MLPEPHLCTKCKKELVWTDCLPATCYNCNAKEKQTTPPDQPIVVDHSHQNHTNN